MGTIKNLELYNRKLQYLEEQHAMYGINSQLDLLLEIDGLKKVVEVSKQVLTGEISEFEGQEIISSYESDYYRFLRIFKKRLNNLGLYAGKEAPPYILTEISDIETAVEITERALRGEIGQDEWREGVALLQIDFKLTDEETLQESEDIPDGELSDTDSQRIVDFKVKRLQNLREIQAWEGINTKVDTIIEIENLEAEIEKLKAESTQLPQSLTVDSQDEPIIIEQALKNNVTSPGLWFKKFYQWLTNKRQD